MVEREITGKIGKALRDDPAFGTCAWEAKLCRGKTLYKGELKDHQRRNLTIASMGQLYYKIEDVGLSQKPFDGFVLKRVEAYVVIWFQMTQKAHETWALAVEDVPSGKITVEYCRKMGRPVKA